MNPLRIGSWTLHPDRHELVGPAGSRRLQPRLTALLLALAATPGRTVSREALLDTVWTRKVLNDEVLSRSIADLRTALDDDAREPRYIETIPKTGYRLIAAVGPVEVEPAIRAAEPALREAEPALRGSDGSRDTRWPTRRLALLLPAIALAGIGALLLRDLTPNVAPPALPSPAAQTLTPTAIAKARPFTSESGWELTPRLSPDGKVVAYASAQVDDQHSVIVLQGRDGTRQRELGGDDPAWHHCPVFSPDGRDLLWLRAGSGGCVLLREGLIGAPRRELAVCAPRTRSCPDWSADGTTLVFTAPPHGSDRGAGLALLDFASGRVTLLTDPPIADGADTEPRFEPDGVHVSFQRGTEWGRVLMRVPRAGGTPVVVRGEREMMYGHDWSADGRDAAFASDSHGPRALSRLGRDGAIEHVGAQGARYPDLAADGTLVYELARYDANLWRLVPGGKTEPLAITRSTRYDGHPNLSPDGRRVAYSSNRDGHDVLWLVDVDGTNDRRLQLDAQRHWVRPNWLPDGSGLLVTRYGPDDTTDVWRLGLAAERPEPLTGLGTDAYDANYDETGKWLYFLRGKLGARALFRVDAARAGAPAEILAPPIDRYVVRNGRVAVHRNDGTDIEICAADGSACRASGANLEPDRRGAWDISDDWLYFAARPDAKSAARLFRLPLEGSGAREEVATLPPNAIGPSVSVARDGSQIIIARTDDVAIDLMIVDPPQR